MKRILDKRYKLDINLETPACVILEIAWALGINADEQQLMKNEIYRTSVLITIQNTPAYVLAKPYSDDGLAHIALFLNPDDSIEWDEDSLIKAFNHTWILQENVNQIESYICGYPTPNKTKSASPVYIYRYLISKGIRTRYDTSMKDLYQLMNGFHYKRDYLYVNVCSLLALAERSTLIELYIALDSTSNQGDQGKKLNEKLLTEAFSKKKYYKQPKSNEEAVFLAAIEFRKDISSFPIPILAYCELVNEQFTSSPYERKLMGVDPRMYDIEERFNPLFPSHVYTETDLKKMSERVGLNKYSSLQRNYDQLVSYYLVDAFHYGVIPGVPLETSIQNEDITKYRLKDIVSYGSYGSSFVAYTVEELIYMFQSNEYFYDPVGGIYSTQAINSLELIARRLKHRQLWGQLLEIMIWLKKRVNDLNFHKESFKDYYQALECEEKSRMEKRLRTIMKLGLIFRGWKQDEKWPIRHVPAYNSEEVAVLTVKPFEEFMKSLDLNNSVDKKLSALPLIRVEAKTHTLMINNDIKDGLKLGQRLTIIHQRTAGESCIRTSSSFLLATAYTFLQAIKLPIQQEQDFQRIKIVL